MNEAFAELRAGVEAGDPRADRALAEVLLIVTRRPIPAQKLSEDEHFRMVQFAIEAIIHEQRWSDGEYDDVLRLLPVPASQDPALMAILVATYREFGEGEIADTIETNPSAHLRRSERILGLEARVLGPGPPPLR